MLVSFSIDQLIMSKIRQHIKKYLDELLKQGDKIDTILLACTHYPLIKKRIEKFLPADIKVIAQGEIVAESLKDYLQRHLEQTL